MRADKSKQCWEITKEINKLVELKDCDSGYFYFGDDSMCPTESNIPWVCVIFVGKTQREVDDKIDEISKTVYGGNK